MTAKNDRGAPSHAWLKRRGWTDQQIADFRRDADAHRFAALKKHHARGQPIYDGNPFLDPIEWFNNRKPQIEMFADLPKGKPQTD